ncbi:hypothetical protein [Paracoccus spongiarum]|uniref:Uncharacterized protein n=1 Tax=Paracoccus spongiarum TaxID=3064387 RepID=A0ABT9J7N5_9RHOB|nr:hypothetical protein [Paracoccus sp. 2205BS29-5]MDP5305811.1 hypothetical protein [Paracoccus sp. 2205BS29-5]
MAERPGIWGMRGLTVLALLAIAGGLWVSGGPMQGRAERRDQMRSADLSALTAQAECRGTEAGAATADLGPTALCPETPRLADPATGAPYRITVLDRNNLRLCADFELPADKRLLAHEWQPGIDADGCIVYRLNRPF